MAFYVGVDIVCMSFRDLNLRCSFSNWVNLIRKLRHNHNHLGVPASKFMLLTAL